MHIIVIDDPIVLPLLAQTVRCSGKLTPGQMAVLLQGMGLEDRINGGKRGRISKFQF
jgi:hypothetical protein